MLTAWVVTGLLMILLELFLPGMVLGFLGASALIVAALVLTLGISLTACSDSSEGDPPSAEAAAPRRPR